MIGGGPQKITVEIGGKIARSLAGSLRTAQMQVSSFGRNVTRTMNDAALAGRKGFKGIFDNALWQQAAAGAAGIGLALAGSVRVAASFEAVLSDIGKTSGASAGQLKTLSAQLLALSARNRTNLGPEKLAQGIQDLVAQGLSLEDAVASMEALGRVATATNSDLLDVTKTGFQLQNALRIRPTDLKATFDALAFAGKAGAFELKDMAQFMPTIAAAAGTLGIQGKQGAVALAAMMQMVRKDAPDAGQAATRLTDAMLKLTAPDAVKNFQKFGINIQQVLANAKAKGINPMEAALTELQRVTGGDIFKLSQIFGDKEAKLALMSLMKYRREYEKLKAEAGGAPAAGTVDRDYERSIATFQGTLASFQNTSQRLGITIGNALLPPLTRMAEAITPLVEKFAAFAEKNPTITTGIVALAGAFAGLVAIAPFVAGLISIIGTIGAVVSGPMVLAALAIVGIGAALVLAYNKVGWFRDGVNAAWQAITTAFSGFVTVVGGAWKIFTGLLTGDTERIKQGFFQMIAGVKTMFAAWMQWTTTLFSNLIPRIIASFQRLGPGILAVMFPIPSMIIRLFNAAGIGQKMVTSILDGLKARAGALFSWIGGAVSRVGSMINGGGSPGPSPAAPQPPGRATGGGVRAGMPYVVGERRRELFVPGMDGAIIPRIARPMAAGGGSVTINAPVTIHAGAGDAMAIRDQVRAAFEDLMAMANSGYRVALND